MANVNKLNWEIFSTQERNSAIEELKNIISRNEGYIINFNLFSDLALSLTIEIEENNILNLYKELVRTFKISEPEPENLNSNSKRDCWVLMNMSFSKGKGNLKVGIPDVPG